MSQRNRNESARIIILFVFGVPVHSIDVAGPFLLVIFTLSFIVCMFITLVFFFALSMPLNAFQCVSMPMDAVVGWFVITVKTFQTN